jgi:ADP-heptose:LPS heptosyltransferase
LLSVNTGPVHIAAAVDTPVVVLYAQTNPQHTPWMVPNRVLQFPVPAGSQSKNEVLKYLQQTIYRLPVAMPQANDIMEAVMELLKC